MLNASSDDKANWSDELYVKADRAVMVCNKILAGLQSIVLTQHTNYSLIILVSFSIIFTFSTKAREEIIVQSFHFKLSPEILFFYKMVYVRFFNSKKKY